MGLVGTRKKSNAIEIVSLMNIIFECYLAYLIAHCSGFWYSTGASQSIPKRPSDLFPAPLYSRSMAVRIAAAELLANN